MSNDECLEKKILKIILRKYVESGEYIFRDELKEKLLNSVVISDDDLDDAIVEIERRGLIHLYFYTSKRGNPQYVLSESCKKLL